MTRFLIRRILQGLFVMWLMTVTVFLIFFVGPGPGFVARVLAGRNATPVQVAAVSHRLLLDRPVYVQYGHFIWLLLHGNLGYDYYHSESVNTVLASALPITLSLVLGASILWLAMGLASGVVSAVRTGQLPCGHAHDQRGPPRGGRRTVPDDSGTALEHAAHLAQPRRHRPVLRRVHPC